jgi:hypothetical protein
MFFCCFCANKESILHVTSCIILLFYYFILLYEKLFEHVMSLTYERVLFSYVSCEYVNIVQQFVNKRINGCKK